jgi:peptidoglycan/xylan/chitin deacetylase (PgdA/CDA1 family)
MAEGSMVMKTKAAILIFLVALVVPVVLLSIQYQDTEKPRTVVQSQNTDMRRTVVLFFDDARVSQYDIALPLEESQYNIPLLREFGFHATFAVIVGSVDQPGSFTKEQMAELKADGMEIASHTVNHVRLSQLDSEQLRHELVDSKTKLEAMIHEPVSTLIVPYDEPLTPRVEKAIIDAGYSSTRPLNSTYWVYGQNETEVYSWLERANGTILLAYHQIRDYADYTPECEWFSSSLQPYAAEKCMTPPVLFENEMEYLHTHGYRVVSWRECLSAGCWHFSWPIPRDQLPSPDSLAHSPWSTLSNRYSEISCQEQLGLGMPTLSIPYDNRRSLL